MKNKSIIKAVAIMVALTFLLTWVIPSATAGTESVTIGSIRPTGFADIFSSLDVIAYYFIRPSIFIIFVGMFYGVINKTGAFKAVVDKVVSLFKNIILCISNSINWYIFTNVYVYSIINSYINGIKI